LAPRAGVRRAVGQTKVIGGPCDEFWVEGESNQYIGPMSVTYNR
jgi:hypothetical protein